MNEIESRHLTGERALFRCKDTFIENCTFDDGESPLKEGRKLTVKGCAFGYKYPLWYGKGHKVSSCLFLPLSRSGIWYTDDSSFSDLDIKAPKEFRRCKNISLERIRFSDAQETLWNCDGVTLEQVKVKGDYFGRNTSKVKGRNLVIDGNYIFDGGKDLERRDCVFHSKDAFWNCKNVTLINCIIEGEYFAWNSENVTCIGCHFKSHQGFCYRKNLIRKDCTISSDSDLIFEYCENLDCDIHSSLGTIKNPVSGKIRCLGYQEYIKDDERIDLSRIEVIKQ